MRVYDNGAFFSVSVSASELQAFADRWPCSGMRGATRGMWFQFSKRNGDLVDIKGERKGYDGVAVSALSQDAQTYGEKQFRCTNCSGPLPENHGTTSKDSKHKFCDACAGLAEALNIGNPATRAVFLYEGSTDGPIAGLRAVLRRGCGNRRGRMRNGHGLSPRELPELRHPRAQVPRRRCHRKVQPRAPVHSAARPLPRRLLSQARMDLIMALKIENHADVSDEIEITTSDARIFVWREEDGTVHVAVVPEGATQATDMVLVLGRPD